MAKEEKKVKKEEKAKGADKGVKAQKAKKAASAFDLASQELVPTLVKGNVEVDGETIRINYRKPRSSTRLDAVLSVDDVVAVCVASEDDGGYIITDHSQFASSLFADRLEDAAVENGFWVGSDSSGNTVMVNTSKVNVVAVAAA